MAYDPEVWGPHYWFVIHSVAFGYPDHPSAVQRKISHRFVTHLPELMPDHRVGNEFSRLLDLYPVTPYLDRKEDFVKWTHFIHNKINEKLDKPLIPLTEHYRIFDEAYRPKRSKIQTILKRKSKLVLCIFIIIIALLIVYLKRK